MRANHGRSRSRAGAGRRRAAADRRGRRRRRGLRPHRDRRTVGRARGVRGHGRARAVQPVPRRGPRRAGPDHAPERHLRHVPPRHAALRRRAAVRPGRGVEPLHPRRGAAWCDAELRGGLPDDPPVLPAARLARPRLDEAARDRRDRRRVLPLRAPRGSGPAGRARRGARVRQQRVPHRLDGLAADPHRGGDRVRVLVGGAPGAAPPCARRRAAGRVRRGDAVRRVPRGHGLHAAVRRALPAGQGRRRAPAGTLRGGRPGARGGRRRGGRRRRAGGGAAAAVRVVHVARAGDRPRPVPAGPPPGRGAPHRAGPGGAGHRQPRPAPAVPAGPELRRGAVLRRSGRDRAAGGGRRLPGPRAHPAAAGRLALPAGRGRARGRHDLRRRPPARRGPAAARALLPELRGTPAQRPRVPRRRPRRHRVRGRAAGPWRPCAMAAPALRRGGVGVRRGRHRLGLVAGPHRRAGGRHRGRRRPRPALPARPRGTRRARARGGGGGRSGGAALGGCRPDAARPACGRRRAAAGPGRRAGSGARARLLAAQRPRHLLPGHRGPAVPRAEPGPRALRVQPRRDGHRRRHPAAPARAGRAHLRQRPHGRPDRGAARQPVRLSTDVSADHPGFRRWRPAPSSTGSASATS